MATTTAGTTITASPERAARRAVARRKAWDRLEDRRNRPDLSEATVRILSQPYLHTHETCVAEITR